MERQRKIRRNTVTPYILHDLIGIEPEQPLASVARMERQRNPGSVFEPLDRSRIPLRSIRATFVPSSLPGLTHGCPVHVFGQSSTNCAESSGGEVWL